MKSPIGVIMKKNIMPRMIGLVIECSNAPNLSQSLLAGRKRPGANSAKTRKNADSANAQRCGVRPLMRGSRATAKKRMKKVRPKNFSEVGSTASVLAKSSCVFMGGCIIGRLFKIQQHVFSFHVIFISEKYCTWDLSAPWIIMGYKPRKIGF